jgi:hypothetical protein
MHDDGRRLLGDGQSHRLTIGASLRRVNDDGSRRAS